MYDDPQWLFICACTDIKSIKRNESLTLLFSDCWFHHTEVLAGANLNQKKKLHLTSMASISLTSGSKLRDRSRTSVSEIRAPTVLPGFTAAITLHCFTTWNSSSSLFEIATWLQQIQRCHQFIDLDAQRHYDLLMHIFNHLSVSWKELLEKRWATG